MNRDSGGAEEVGSVDLAREAPFALAHLAVTPAALRVAAAGWSQRLEPRAMQVLVLLAHAAPAVVGRPELNARVWGGRVVGDDAINRAVQTLRRLAAEAPAPVPFRIETIPRVGYRLSAADRASHPVAAAPADSLATVRDAPAPVSAPVSEIAGDRRRRARRWAPLLLAPLVVAGAVLAWRAVTMDHEGAAWTIARARTLDDLPAGASDAALSADGRRLAYRGSDPRGHDRIFVRAVTDGGAGQAVSPPEFDAGRPSWSPDGSALAFAAYDRGQPCRLYVLRPHRAAAAVGTCETGRDPHLAWSADGRSLLFDDASGWNAVTRISAVRVADGERSVLSNPPGDGMGDDLPLANGGEILFRREFGWADQGWIARDLATGRERLLWRRDGLAGSFAALLPGGSLAIGWTRAGASGLDVIDAAGRVRSQPVALGQITAMSAAGQHLLVETDRRESALARAEDAAATPLLTVRGQIAGPALLADGRLRFPVTSAGVARIWERDRAGALRPWGSFTAARIVGVAPSPDGRRTAALAAGAAGREIVVLDDGGRPIFRWNPHARALNPAAWSGDGRHLIAPMLDGAGWRLFVLDPFAGAPPRDLGRPGFAVLLSDGAALYAVRAGETTGSRELWRLDGAARRLPIDLSLFDIVNWRPVAHGVWLPERSDRVRPRLVLRDIATGRIVRVVAAPGLAGPASGLAADGRGPVYVQAVRDAPEYDLLTLARTPAAAGR